MSGYTLTYSGSEINAAIGKIANQEALLSILAISINTPASIYASSIKSWPILNYDSFRTYSTSATAGTISIIDSSILYIAPDTEQTVIITITVDGISREISLNVIDNTITKIGIAGAIGFGVGVYPEITLPSGFSALTGTTIPSSDEFGNYQYQDGSIMCWIPAFYYRIGSTSSPLYATYGVNSIDIAELNSYASENAANTDGFALHRAFKNGGQNKTGFMADKYQCSNYNNIASSVKNGNPLSSSSLHNGFSTLTGIPANFYYGALGAAKTRGTQFHCMSRFQVAALALLATAHGQAATSSTYCAWYDASLITNFPKGCNNNALKDTNDTTVIWQSDGYSNCGKTGSAGYGGGAGNVFAKSTHNGQNCGVADLNGNIWEINTGLTRPGTTSSDSSEQNDAAAFYVLKESVDVNVLNSGWSDLASGNEAWGTATHLATLYDPITLSQISSSVLNQHYGNGTNQVLDPANSGSGYIQTGLGIPTLNGHNSTGINMFGKDYFCENHRANLCLISGGRWADAGNAGIWTLVLNYYRTGSYYSVGFRSAAYV